MKKDLQVKQNSQLNQLNEEQIKVIKSTIAKDATDTELQLFITQCNRTQLDPFSRQIYFAKGKDGRPQINATIDGFRVIAERSGKYQGQDGPYWCGEDGVWKDVWLSPTPPKASKVGILRSDFTTPIWGVATWDGYVQKNQYGFIGQWGKNGSNQLAKCAESLALRKAFPQDLSGIYSSDEMQSVDTIQERPTHTMEVHEEVETQDQIIVEPQEVEQESIEVEDEPASAQAIQEAFSTAPEEDKPIREEPTPTDMKATDKQVNMIKGVIKSKKVTQTKLKEILADIGVENINYLTKRSASDLIKALQELPMPE